MKKIILLLGVLLLLTSCYSNPKYLGKIKELEDRIITLENNIDYKEKDFIFNKNIECSKYIDKEIEKLESIYEYVGKNQIFYSPSKNTCIFAYIGLDPSENFSIYIIEDVITKQELSDIFCTNNKCSENKDKHFTRISEFKN